MDIDPTTSDSAIKRDHTSGKIPPLPKNIKDHGFDELSAAPQSAEDPVSLSEEQEVHTQLLNAIRQTPDIRHEKVREIQQALEAGTYRISGEAIADRIIQDTLNNQQSNND